MRILYVTGMYPTPMFPQKGIFCHQQVKALQELGIDVDVVAPLVFYDREVKREYWEYEGVIIKYIRFFKIPGNHFFHKTGQWLYRELEHAVNLDAYDIYHADAALPAGHALMKAAQKYDKPFVVHGHGLDVFLERSYGQSINIKKITALSKEVYHNADAICGVSRKVIERIKAGMRDSIQDYVVYNGVDVDRFYPAPHEKGDGITILSVGNLIPLKGHEYTIKALQELKKKGYKVRLQLLGRGPQKEYLHDLVKNLGLVEDVKFVGYVPYEDVVYYMQNADIFVLPSDYEALGCVYLEAMACGLPVVGCYGNGIDEIISAGRNGYLVKGKSAEQIADCIEEYYNRADKASMGENARRTVVENYQWKHSALRLQQIYDKIYRKK